MPGSWLLRRGEGSSCPRGLSCRVARSGEFQKGHGCPVVCEVTSHQAMPAWGETVCQCGSICICSFCCWALSWSTLRLLETSRCADSPRPWLLPPGPHLLLSPKGGWPPCLSPFTPKCFLLSQSRPHSGPEAPGPGTSPQPSLFLCLT